MGCIWCHVLNSINTKFMCHFPGSLHPHKGSIKVIKMNGIKRVSNMCHSACPHWKRKKSCHSVCWHQTTQRKKIPVFSAAAAARFCGWVSFYRENKKKMRNDWKDVKERVMKGKIKFFKREIERSGTKCVLFVTCVGGNKFDTFRMRFC